LHCRKGDSRLIRQQWVVQQMLELLCDEF
jgi:hypothetical protein